MSGVDEFLAGFVTRRRLERIERVLAGRTRHLAVVLEDLHKPHNASACLRTCDCFGVQDVHVVENANEFSVSRKVALGAAQWLTVRRYNGAGAVGGGAAGDGVDSGSGARERAGGGNTGRCFEALRGAGYRVVALTPGAECSVYEYDVRRKTAVVFGNELDGLSEEALALADERMMIPTWGFTQSLNVSVAVAISVSELVRRLRLLDVEWRLSEDERQALRGEWIRTALGGRAGALERAFLRGMG